MVDNLADYYGRVGAIEDPSGDPNATSPTGAKGQFQFTKGTWNAYGNGGDITNPADQAAAMARLTAANASALTSVLGRPPTPEELYLAHQQGATGATKLLQNPNATPASLGLGDAVAVNNGNPNAPASAFVNKYANVYDNVTPSVGGATPATSTPATQVSGVPTGGIGGTGAPALPSAADAFAMAPQQPTGGGIGALASLGMPSTPAAPVFTPPQQTPAGQALQKRRLALLSLGQLYG
jgi:hypothetical protein